MSRPSWTRTAPPTRTTRSDGAGDGAASGARVVLGPATWIITGQLYAKAVGVASYFFMVRHLSPDDVGTVALCWLSIAIGDTFFDLGLAHAYVRDGRRGRREESSLFWAVTGLALAWIGLSSVAGPLLAVLFDAAEAASMMIALSSIYAFRALGITQLSIQIVERRVGGIVAREAVAATAAALLGVGLAVAGFGAWALVARLVCQPAASSLLAAATTRWRPSFAFDRRWLDRQLRFGVPLCAATNIHWLVVLQVEGYLVGHSLGLTALGLLQFAKKPTEVLSQSMNSIQRFHLLRELSSALGSPHEWRTVLRREIALYAALGTGAALASLCIAGFALELVWGERWSGATVPMAILALAAPFVTVQGVATSALVARGALGPLFRANLLWAVVTCTAVWMGTHGGLVAVAWALALSLAAGAGLALMALRASGREEARSRRRRA